MFGNRAFQVKLVKADNAAKTEPLDINVNISPETTNRIVNSYKDMLNETVKGAVVVAGATVLGYALVGGVNVLIQKALDKD